MTLNEKNLFCASAEVREFVCSYPSYDERMNRLCRDDNSTRLIYVEEGVVCTRIHSGNVLSDRFFEKGTLICGLPYSLSGSGSQGCEGETFVVSFSDKYIRLAEYEFSLSRGVRLLEFFHTPFPPPEYVRELLAALGRMAKYPFMNDASISLCRTLFRIVHILLGNMKNNISIGKSEKTWLLIDDYIRNHIHERITRKETATSFKLNQSYLSELCREKTGRGFNEFVREHRLSRAAAMLSMNLTIDEIAFRCGFENTSYFIRLFKKKYGKSPGKYRLE